MISQLILCIWIVVILYVNVLRIIFWLNKWNRFSQGFYMKFRLCLRFSSLKIWKILYMVKLKDWNCWLTRSPYVILGVWHFKTRKVWNIDFVGSLARPMWFWGFDTLNREKYGIPEKLENGDLWKDNTKNGRTL